MEVKHEIVPFKLDGLWLETAFNVPIFELVPVVGTPEQHKANAEFLLHACNNHYDLIGAAKTALGVAEEWIHDQLDGTSSLEAELQALDPVRAAIAKAEGRS